MLFNILAPGVMEDHITFGFSKGLSSGDEFSMAFMYALSKETSGPNALDPTQMIHLEMKQWEIELCPSFAPVFWGQNPLNYTHHIILHNFCQVLFCIYID